jgi:hypothetical protein
MEPLIRERLIAYITKTSTFSLGKQTTYPIFSKVKFLSFFGNVKISSIKAIILIF